MPNLLVSAVLLVVLLVAVAVGMMGTTVVDAVGMMIVYYFVGIT
jgi:hypothetical protein